MEDRMVKSSTLRNNEYYCMQETFDYLHNLSVQNYNFKSLIKYIISERNISLAYRNIKTNKGSKAKGISGYDITFIAKMKLHAYINLIKKLIENYKPSMIRRVGIPKANGKIRYLGIKEPWEKIIEQAIYQILEPILVHKFHKNSNGFIKGRSCERAISQFNNYVVKEKLYFIVDIDIKSFFDNINHAKLIKQLWSSGIRDKNLLSLISKLIKSKVQNVGIAEKGLPQGGVLSPLLANLVLNEFDWWLDSKASKGVKFVRYADDVKILCPSYSVAKDMLGKAIKWLENRLKLEVSEEKTKIVNLKRNYTTFLSFKIKVKKDKDKFKIISHMSDKAKENTKKKISKQIRKVKKNSYNEEKCRKETNKLNSMIRGIHNYTIIATEIRDDLRYCNYITYKYIYKNLRHVLTFSDKIIENDSITNRYGKGKMLPYIRGSPIIPIGNINYRAPKEVVNDKNYFDSTSRRKFHRELKIDNLFMLEKLMKAPYYYETVEFNDNRLSKFCGQLGKYAITGNDIYDLLNCHTIRIKNNKDDKYDNIIIVESKIKRLIETKGDDIIELYNLKKGLTLKQLEKINLIRKENSLPLI